jgi:hypothetical protein
MAVNSNAKRSQYDLLGGGSKPGWCESLFVETELTVRIQVEQ